jgi:DNA-binding response OmpR family regulator
MSNLFALIVEDDTDLSIIFAKALEAAGFETQIVRAGDTAMMWLSSTTPEVVVLDLHLPRVSGKDVLGHVRSNERLVDTKVIIVTADPRMAETLQDQADLILLKPIGFGQLRDLAARLGYASPGRQQPRAFTSLPKLGRSHDE